MLVPACGVADRQAGLVVLAGWLGMALGLRSHRSPDRKPAFFARPKPVAGHPTLTMCMPCLCHLLGRMQPTGRWLRAQHKDRSDLGP
ncbi:hypothetical protein HaLaN_12829 [Haematococcus lacustris]|uniref:Uncharacterized protein n=1 Tax=Haematococcus lacustris TaxID=44745 RepID=A0A699ZKW2_HAELA|nr:hypothetical protein HaLaN_12829 [Haematococcus lacustris]